MKTLVIFDIDGTLLHSNKVDSETFAETYESQFGQPFPSIDWRNYPHVTDHTIFNEVIRQHFDRPASAADIDRQQSHFVAQLCRKRELMPEVFREVPGAVSTVNNLLNLKEYVVGIATGGWRAPAQIKLKHLGFPIQEFYASYADNKITREDILKESIELARAAHPDIQRTVYIGDAIWDVTTTRNMGLNFIGVRLRGDYETLEQVGARQVIQDYQDQDYFLRLLKTAVPPV
jgi:phosphoglycolate phosphatase-like HAD superfamily hydrolase